MPPFAKSHRAGKRDRLSGHPGMTTTLPPYLVAGEPKCIRWHSTCRSLASVKSSQNKAMRDLKPQLSIRLPVYNGEKYLSQALDALLIQMLKNFERIICDSASTDTTERICRSYVTQDRRITYCCNARNSGAAKNYRAFELSRGRYFEWATHHDLCAPTMRERCIDVLETRSDGVLGFPKTNIIGAEGKFLRQSR